MCVNNNKYNIPVTKTVTTINQPSVNKLITVTRRMGALCLYTAINCELGI